MTFAIVIPTYNGEKYVEQAIKSALSQTRVADEIIISDDNSTDSTLEICRKYSNRLKIFTNPKGPSGFVNGWNNAIAYATADYISILHQDDIISPTFLEEIENAISQNPDVKHLFSCCYIINGDGEIIRKPTEYFSGTIYRFTGQEYANAYERVKGHIHRCPGVVTHKDIFTKCKYRAEAGHIADDDFFIRVGHYTDVVGILKPLASYREHSTSETGHLSHLTLIHRLLRDYHFQLKHSEDNPLLSNEIKGKFMRWESEYIHQLITWSIKSCKWNYIPIALHYWLSIFTSNRYGNIIYDLKSLSQIIKSKLRKSHVSFLKHRAERGKNFFGPNNGRVTIVAPHPDDEVIGCGGLIARLVAEGNPPQIIVMTGGEASHHSCCSASDAEIKNARRGLTRRALAILGVPESNIHELDFVDGQISADDREVEKIKAIFEEINPDTVLVPHWGEGWPDHIKTAEIVNGLLPEGIHVWEYCVWMWYYNVWRRLDWRNAAVLKMTPEEHELKLNAIDAYIKPLAPCGNPWSGVLPQIFINAHQGNIELYFKCGTSK